MICIKHIRIGVSNMRLIPHNYEEGTKKWQEVINDKLFMRPVYIKEQQSIEYSRVAKQILGVYTTAYDMQEYLDTLTNSSIQWTLLFENLPKQIDATKRTDIVNILQMHRENPISLNRFMAFFAGKQLLPLMDTKYRNRFRLGR
ncbi:YceG family protein [Kurthia senegalensis]|uniref:YceG family protein n=1 Tax=Kurthia senegalensis TaxID=1033740 RepID=UPI002E236A4E